MKIQKICLSHRRGFTLIELLTVIAIIGILAAIIIPTVSKVRESAKNAKCLSNLRSVMTAANLYANDNKGKFPYSRDYGLGTRNSSRQPDGSMAPGTTGLIDYCWPYANNSFEIFYCPGIPASHGGSFESQNARASGVYPGPFLNMGYYWIHSENTPTSWMVASLHKQVTQSGEASRVMMTCRYNNGTFYPHHSGKPPCNVGFADGHVRAWTKGKTAIEHIIDPATLLMTKQ